MTASAWRKGLPTTPLMAAAMVAAAAAVAALAGTARAQTAMPEVTLPRTADADAPPRMEIIKVPDWRGRARDMVETLSEYSRARAPNAPLLMRGGASLLFRSERDDELAALAAPAAVAAAAAIREPEPVGALQRQFARAIDGVVVDGLSCGFTPPLTPDQIGRLQAFGLRVLSIEACPTEAAAATARQGTAKHGVLSYVTTDENLAAIPTGRLGGANAEMVQAIGKARTILFNLDNRRHATKGDWLEALRDTNHDVVVIEPFFRGDKPLTPQDVYSLKLKKMGTPRLVLARLPLTVAHDTAWYWKAGWKVGNPSFIRDVGERPGEFVVNYAHPEWQSLVGQTFAGLLDLGFDGIMLDGMDAVAALDEDSAR